MKHFLLCGIVVFLFPISHSVPDFCKLNSDEGEGEQFKFAVFYDYEKDQCSPFLYKGEKGNANRFDSEKECMRNCSERAEEIYPMEAYRVCFLKKELGGCSGTYLHYYYDPVHDKCKKFLYTGCIGNGNRFADYATCNATCDGIHEDGDELEEDEPDTPIAIICGILIGVIVAAILITVIVLSVKSSNQKSKKKTGAKSKDPQTDTPLQDRDIEME